MRLLRFSVSGNSLYEGDTFSMDLFALNRVMHGDSAADIDTVTQLGSSRIYSQNVLGISGVNASGKTTTLGLLHLMAYVLNIPSIIRSDRLIRDRPPAKLARHFATSATFWHAGDFYLLESQMERVGGPDDARWLRIDDETLWKLDSHTPAKACIKDTERFKQAAHIIMRRNGSENEEGALTQAQRTFLRSDVSIVSSLVPDPGSKQEIPSEGLLHSEYPTPVVHAFDDSVESLSWDEQTDTYRLKFAGEKPRILSEETAMGELSFGTVVGTAMVGRAVDVLRSGGMLIIDEIENGLNKSLVRTIIELFLSGATNPHGAQLIFTTHYPEILDFLPRKDDVYLLVRGSDHRTRVVKYSDCVKRIENKKSEVILANLIAGSMPSYPDIEGLRAYVRGAVHEREPQ